MGNKAGSLKQHIETAEKTGSLSFSDKGLEKFPPELVKVVNNLRNLDLSNNKITQLPDNIGSFKMLKTLALHKNKLSELPVGIGKLTKLETLSLQSNLLTRLPSAFGQLKHLKELNLSHNDLTAFPTALFDLGLLDILDLSNNKITNVPDGVDKLEVTEMNLNQNQISSLSPSLASCPRLKTLRLEENCLSLDAIPSGLLTTSTVSLLALEGNLFDIKKLEDSDGFDKYMERFTAVRRKLD